MLGVDPPDDEEECAALGREMNRRARLEYAAFLPDAGEAIESLNRRFALHTSSGNERWVIEGMLERLGVRARFGITCGADLAGVRKGTPKFHPAVFILAGVEAHDAIIVDDRAEVVRLGAAQTGAAGVLVAREAPADAEGIDLVVPSLAALADRLTADRRS